MPTRGRPVENGVLQVPMRFEDRVDAAWYWVKTEHGGDLNKAIKDAMTLLYYTREFDTPDADEDIRTLQTVLTLGEGT